MLYIFIIQLIILFTVIIIYFSWLQNNKNFDKDKISWQKAFFYSFINYVITIAGGALMFTLFTMFMERGHFTDQIGLLLFYAAYGVMFSFIAGFFIPAIGYKYVLGLEISKNTKRKLLLLLGIFTVCTVSLPVAVEALELFSISMCFGVIGIFSTVAVPVIRKMV